MFLDSETMNDNLVNQIAHVRTMYTNIIHYCGDVEAIVLGLNHIPLINTNTQETIQVVVDTFMHKYVKY